MEAAKPKAIELLYASSKKLLGTIPVPKGARNNSEFAMNFNICKELASELRYEAVRNNTLKSLSERLEFHLKKLEGG